MLGCGVFGPMYLDTDMSCWHTRELFLLHAAQQCCRWCEGACVGHEALLLWLAVVCVCGPLCWCCQARRAIIADLLFAAQHLQLLWLFPRGLWPAAHTACGCNETVFCWILPPQAVTSPAWHLLSPKDPRRVCFGALPPFFMLCGSQPVARRHPGTRSAAGSTAQQLGSSFLHCDLPLVAGWAVGWSLYLRLPLE